MKKNFPVLIIIVPVILSACAAPTSTALPSTESASPALTVVTAAAGTVEPMPVSIPVSTAISTTPDFTTIIPTSMDSTNTVPDNPDPASYTVTLTDNGKTFSLHIGDDILLDLGADMYDWDVTVDDQSVISRRIGDAQMVFDALGTGRANLTATGNPKCINSTPSCMMPSIMFEIMVVVQ